MSFASLIIAILLFFLLIFLVLIIIGITGSKKSKQSGMSTPQTPAQTSSLISSKIKAINLSYVIIVIVLVLMIIAGAYWLTGDRDVEIKGDYIKKDGAIYIENGTCIITKTVYGRYPHATFDVRGNGTAEVIFRDCNPEFGFKDFHSGVVKFDTKGKIRKIVFKTDMNAISVRIGRDFTYLYAIDNAEKFRTREVKLIITGKDIWVDNFKA